MTNTTDQILDNILIPRANGSEGLKTVGSYLKQTLNDNGATVSEHVFSSTPYGFQLVWLAVMLLMLSYVFFIYRKSYGLALLMCLITPVLLLSEFEWMLSPVSGLISGEQVNIIGIYPGADTTDNAKTLIFSAHYDATTHFGDHFSWGFWGSMQGPAQGLAFLLVGIGFWRKKNNKVFCNRIAVPAALLATLPFAAMFWFQTIGPMVRAPSIGAIDNGGSMAALLLLSEKIQTRDNKSATTVKIVFLAAEEERGLGSWAYAKELLKEGSANNIQVINLESIGVPGDIAYIPEDGFVLTRYKSSPEIIRFMNAVAQEKLGGALKAKPLPFGVLTDGRSFLSHDIETITLRAFTEGGFPQHLHSKYDSRDRLSVESIEQGADFLWALVQYSDQMNNKTSDQL